MEVSGRLLGQAGAPERPEKATDTTVFLVFLLRFSFSFAFVSLLGCVFRWCPESAYTQMRGRLTRSVVDPAARFAERKPLTGRDRETKNKRKKRKQKTVLRAGTNRASENTRFT